MLDETITKNVALIPNRFSISATLRAEFRSQSISCLKKDFLLD